MKKFLAMLLSVCTCFTIGSFAACKDKDDGNANGPVTEAEWEEMISESTFENYTLTESGTVTPEGYEGTYHTAIIKMTADKVAIDLSLDGGGEDMIIYTGADAIEQKNSYEQVFLALLADFENYTYDEAEKVYKNSGEITVNVTMTDFAATIVMKNGKLTLTEDGKLLTFVCDWTQTTTTPGGTITVKTDMNWAFSDYGTTVIAE